MKSRMEVMTGRVAAVLLVSAGLVMSAAVAQTDAPPPPPQGQMQGGPGGPMQDPGRRAEMLQKMLQLSDDQTAQVKAVLVDDAAKADALRANTDLAPRERRTQSMAIRKDEETRLEAIFTPDQKAKFEDMMAKQRERMQERRDGGAPGGPPPASAPPPSL